VIESSLTMDLPSSRSALRACAVATLLLAPARASAESAADQAKAEALFAEGRRLLAASRFAEACPKFVESQRLDPAIGTQLNLGDCYEKTGRTASAWAVFRDAAAEAHQARDARREAVASERAAALEPRLVKLTILVPIASRAPGLQVKRDGVAVDRAAWSAAVPIDPGWHAVEASAPGKRRWTLPVAIDAAHPTTSITVPPLEDLEARPAAIDAKTDGRSQRLAGGILAGAGAAALGAGAIFTAMAVANDSDSTPHCRGDVCDAAGVKLREDALSDARASTIAVVTGLAAIAGGATLWLTAPASPKRPPGARVGAAPALGPDRVGLTLRGAF
jgi:tetratricopeptide (TPR) repeat protein